MIAAKPQAGLGPPGKARLRAIPGVLMVLALVGVVSATAFYTVCAGFSWYDDTGYFMLTQRTLAAGHPLYDQTFTQYGPAYYAWERLLHTVTRLPLSHDTTLLFTAFAVVASSFLCAGFVARLGRNLFLTAFTFLAVATLLLLMKCEPGHPQELCALLLTGMMFGASFLTSGRHRAMILGALGFGIGVLSMTKPNLGVFAAVAGSLSLCRLAPAGRVRIFLFGASVLAAVVLPVALMRHNLPAVAEYCVIELAAILLLALQLARWRPDESLPWRSFAAPLAGFAGALLVCAAYALATGTSGAGLARGLLFQHVGFDQLFSFFSPFANRNIILPLAVAAGVWAATGPGRNLWRRLPWVPSALKLGVAPFMVWAVLKLGITEAFLWCLPLVAATAMPSPGQPGSAWELAPRCFALSLAVLSAMWGYPVWGAQAGLSFFLLIPVALVSCADALRYGCWSVGGSPSPPVEERAGERRPRKENLALSTPEPQGNIQHPTSNIEPPRAALWAIIGCWAFDVGCWMFPGFMGRKRERRPMWLALSYALVAGVIGLAVLQASQAAGAYHRLEPPGLRGSRLLRLPREQADFYRRLVQAAQAHGRSFFTMPGLGSLYFWANQDPPTAINPTSWMTLLTPEQQTQVVEDLRHTPDLCVIRWNPLVEFWTRGRDISQNKVVRYLEDNFVTVESFNECDILVRRNNLTTDGHR